MTNSLLSTYRTWTAMKNRCESPLDHGYKDYGGRGITVCSSWQSFDTFLADMGVRPEAHLELNRIDNNKGYCKENCNWVTSAENNKNKRLYSKAVNNSSGVTGVSITRRGYWRAFGGRELLYQGRSFEDACCERKVWEEEQKKVRMK